ncbi:hypothetical protein Pyrfu_1523 [Pyrolobus fumarii 1A]|uniref:Uncharacterized protein n=1 Tax=Pyrolobus fumarii (strain DSM 11204 / 1A) TaxID=694429 RepID=G0EHM7_PYRF1|nr:hypothetical protein [Pyrolobus fumarii]AEM39380.1 hypothetical protein Pyrfu_1523 [Pyrolobus fumarii 1A]
MPSSLISKTLNIDDILDVERRGNTLIVYTRDGELLNLPYNSVTASLYWEIKIRNRRRAFGL